MRLFEYEGKQVLSRYGLRIPRGKIVAAAEEAAEAAAEMGGRVAIKSQVLAGGRGKAGGISFADNAGQARAAASSLLGTRLQGEVVRRLLVEEQLDIKAEYYLGITIDPSAACPVLMLSCEGGVDIEEVSARSPEKIGRLAVDVREGLSPYAGRLLARRMGIVGTTLVEMGVAASGLYQAFRALDAVVAEINPLVATEGGALVAADAKLDLDDDATHRHPEYGIDGRIQGETDLERRARELGIKYVELDGDIGIAGNGAGLMMTTVDIVERCGGRPANFLDGGGVGARGGSGEAAINWWDNIIRLVLANPRVKVLLFNMLSGNQRGHEVASGIVRGLQSSRRVPAVFRLSGTHQEEGRAILRAAGHDSCDSMEEAVRRAVRLAKEMEG